MTRINKLLILNLSIIFLFFGCTPPSAFTFFKKDKLKANALQYTKKADIVSKRQVEAILNVTYLNSVDDEFDDENQNFIVGVFISSDNTKEKNRYLNNKDYSLSMNGRKPFYVKVLSDQHKMYGHLPMFNNWSKYYLIKFNTKDDEENLNVTLQSKKHGSASLSFEAE